ncbi:hypothetical protein LM602_03960 [Candidatus Acetothermia bacterium]|jgi:hypothetical protein|nr:hypothetical protein [Candidatus Acetothermia bacterium]MCI2431697.1 hypothetical protein [Candidatus Acetothermia bacterium]MCI2435672.1 hypothetical protein [Candidatus Acetothermia bacterium]
MKYLLISVLTALLLSANVLALRGQQVTPQDVYSCFRALNVSDLPFLINAYDKGFKDRRITPSMALTLCQRLAQSAAPIGLREGVLRVIGLALIEELPVTMLVDKALEGLAKGVALEAINDELAQRKATLSEVKALFAHKGIRISLTIRFGAVTLELTLEAVDAAITEAARALEDYVRAGQRIEDATAIKATVQRYLASNRAIPVTLVSFIEQIVSAPEWAQLAQNVANRLKK